MKSKFRIKQERSTKSEAISPNASFTTPCNGKITAPPDTPIIMRAEIPFERSVSLFRASEKRIEKTFAHERPITKMAIKIAHKLLPKINGINESVAISRDTLKNLRGRVFKSRNAPKKVPIVLAIK